MTHKPIDLKCQLSNSSSDHVPEALSEIGGHSCAVLEVRLMYDHVIIPFLVEDSSY